MALFQKFSNNASRLLLTKQIQSNKDASKNFIFSKGSKTNNKFFEARYVRRNKDKVSAYVSSHTGCKMACQFCYLTRQGQTSFRHTTLEDYIEQLDEIVDHYVCASPGLDASRLNINFMARGEPLANKIVVNQYPEFHKVVQERYGYLFDTVNMNISTIMPNTLKSIGRPLHRVFEGNPVRIYYSMYASDSRVFKHKWMPNALPTMEALDMLQDLQEHNDKVQVNIHFALIKNENDSMQNAKEIASMLKGRQFNGKFNLVRYNPPPGSSSQEAVPSRIQDFYDVISEVMPSSSRIVPRVGQDAYASCGMFWNENGEINNS